MAQGAYEQPEQGGVVRDSDGRTVVLQAGGTSVAVAAGTAGNTVVKAGPGQLVRVLVTAAGANAMSIYDNATTNTGTIIGQLTAAPPVGTIFLFAMPAALGITIAGSATNPGVTVSFV